MLSFLSKNKSTVKSKAKPGYVRYVNKIGSDAFIDWVIILSISGFISILLIGVGSYVYVDTDNQLDGDGVVSSVSNSASEFDVKKLKSVISTFDVRASERVLLKNGFTVPKDPSLP